MIFFLKVLEILKTIKCYKCNTNLIEINSEKKPYYIYTNLECNCKLFNFSLYYESSWINGLNIYFIDGGKHYILIQLRDNTAWFSDCNRIGFNSKNTGLDFRSFSKDLMFNNEELFEICNEYLQAYCKIKENIIFI
jgi:hypothetical protein